MPKKQQIRNLKRLIGSKYDLIDLEAEVDGRLSYAENKRIVLNKAKRKGIYKSKSNTAFKGSALYYREKAKQIHNKRSVRSKAQDSRKTSKKNFKAKDLTKKKFMLWKKKNALYDIVEVDGKGSYIRTVKTKLSKKQVENVIADIL